MYVSKSREANSSTVAYCICVCSYVHLQDNLCIGSAEVKLTTFSITTQPNDVGRIIK